MYLVFDTETTGLPKNWKAPMTDLDNWPRIIQLAWAFYDDSYQLVEKKVDLIKPDGWVMPTDTFWIENGFSQEKSEAEGIPITDALNSFKDKLEESNYLIAHNMSYDYNVAGAEFIRFMMRSQNKPQKICTKDSSTDYCKIPGPYGYKWPTLMELHTFLFEEGFEGAHDALADVEACARCFFELKKRNIIQI
ncbi:3'-5' exonuclease [Sediminitomix flava]|uniref:DNA polymerase-3 subunit epsilon n=1 Tax=Sediminitomix flava TaxID=379075 RepID=A0A315ZBW3_SEDFL|nr:3'-5' exonuclease [Sediminitomix flava]PWJ42278.1 DNA polymerase-3 subunit epsilon [Sediminitomix flava]